MSEEARAKIPNERRLLDIRNGIEGSYFVAVSHRELDNLVGSLMQLIDIVGSQEQSRALKTEVKQRSRNWLDDLYQMAGYDKWAGVTESANPVLIKD